MPGMMENISTLNSFIRTVLALVVIGGVGGGGWYAYSKYNAKEFEAAENARELATANQKLQDAMADVEAKGKLLVKKDAEISQLNKDIEKLQTRIALLKVDHRLARLTVREQTKSPETGEIRTKVEFVELNDEGVPYESETPRTFDIKGDLIYIDSWIVKFDDKYVEAAEIDRSTSLCLFHRIFGEKQNPVDGFPLDQSGTRPTGYARGGKMTDYEKRIWDDFWEIANDPAKAKEMGIRAASGEAPSMRVQNGKSYRVMLRASGGLSIVPEATEPGSN